MEQNIGEREIEMRCGYAEETVKMRETSEFEGGSMMRGERGEIEGEKMYAVVMVTDGRVAGAAMLWSAESVPHTKYCARPMREK